MGLLLVHELNQDLFLRPRKTLKRRQDEWALGALTLQRCCITLSSLRPGTEDSLRCGLSSQLSWSFPLTVPLRCYLELQQGWLPHKPGSLQRPSSIPPLPLPVKGLGAAKAHGLEPHMDKRLGCSTQPPGRLSLH